MLIVYGLIISVLRELRPSIAAIQKQDGDLANQLRRAAASAALNCSEGQGSRGRNQQLRFSTALGSMRETMACLEVGGAFGYVGPVEEELRAKLDRICGMLYRLSR